MKKFIVNLIVLSVIVLPITLISISCLSYAILLTKFEPTKEIETMKYEEKNSYSNELRSCDYCGIRSYDIKILDGKENKIFICKECEEKERKNNDTN